MYPPEKSKRKDKKSFEVNFRDSFGNYFSVYSVDKHFALKSGEFFEKYKYGYGFESIQKSTNAVVMLVSFVNDYVEGIARGLEFFSDLVFALGVEGNSEIFSERRKLKELVQQEKIDLGFLKFQVRTTAEFTFPRLEGAAVRILEKLDQLKETSYILESDILNTFIKEVENQKNGWKKFEAKSSNALKTWKTEMTYQHV